ncbi:TPA: N-acetylmannosamine-6-phosphate 2-epimerase [Serratia rubidaea]|uniref:N-acetylmannosamine-6-phosphate 2-epimerase n=1 Tax=Serratia rubidaea TaxID=61652 RepID=UPI0023AF5745|nr:N-acetylmannosamine-6-phosphate 2-epimerase [Serratia rubidaea]MDK1704441.1 N-acetylmannosamine-6-phosphate 2-epimerase [Serratia rubidaea]HDJ1437743.1 N-acetylmannosamine-6-phosphate 2-epimerase [Serratia rubidaea]HDJ1447811.1 N-acetylmannosamine-6-phosphate 2-epimerase [Serratia rubidaea]HDJ1460341.1 N-acetylmannosamine-6-phosphate 2-epimerase [Serratia rubidaea]HDJ2774243.1 N-acetylmannosamine-6-phosphate 2-epimerase [Serratia rubidaea]
MTVSMLQQIKGRLVVSCQALEGEPLHSDYIMARMAVAAEVGGAAGIRANSAEDVKAIMRAVTLPVIGIIKRDYADSAVYITPTLAEVDELMSVGPQMIALDATAYSRPGGVALAELVAAIRAKYPQLLLMADIATLAEAISADELGFDCIGTTLHGYTAETRGQTLAQEDFRFLRQVLAAVKRPVIAEGNVATPDMAARCLTLGAHAVVVGGAITRPQQITRRFVQAIGEAAG